MVLAHPAAAERPRLAEELAAPDATASVADPLAALCVVARLHHVAAEPAALRHSLGRSPTESLTADDILIAAKQLGLTAKRSRSSIERLELAALPALALMQDGRWIVLAQCDKQRVLTQDAGSPGSRPTIEPLEAFAARWTGELGRAAEAATVREAIAKLEATRRQRR